jgi:hypothetical protein
MGHEKGRDSANEWVSSLSRNIVLGVGWVLVTAAFSAAVIGLIIGAPVLSVVGTLTGVLGWTISSFVPEPVPAAPKSDRRRLDAVRRAMGHRLPT